MQDGWISKPWGRTRTLILENQLEITECEAVAGGYCSIHLHARKSNTFTVISGTLSVLWYPKAWSREPDVVQLHPAELCRRSSTTIPAGIKHQFIAATDCRFVELYAVNEGSIDPADIVRFSEGGRQ